MESSNRNRGLGWIDFEARKCFTNLEVCDNYVYGANGWAFNGNGKISENITIKNNHLERPSYSWRSIYPYSFTFYSVYPKDLVFEDNTIIEGSIGLGNIYNLSMKNNTFNTGTVGLSITGNCLIENNSGNGTRNQLFNLESKYSNWIIDKTSKWYVPEESRETTLKFINNGTGGICGKLINTTDLSYYNNHTLIFENNHFNKFNVNCYGLKEYKFDITQLNSQITYAARGCKTHGETYTISTDNHFPGGFHFKVGDLISNTTNNIGRCNGIAQFYYSEEGLGLNVENVKTSIAYCSKEGCFPMGGEFLMADGDNWIKSETKKVDSGGFYFTNDNLYYCKTSGELDHIPTHTYGIETNGTAELMWFDNIGRIELVNKTIQ